MKETLLRHCSDLIGWPLLFLSFYLSGIIYTTYLQYLSPIYTILLFLFFSIILGLIVSKCHDIEKRHKK